MKAEQQKPDGQKGLQERQSEATSKETVSDVEREEKIPDTKRSADQTSVPSPDGTPDPDGSRGRADGSDPGGPM